MNKIGQTLTNHPKKILLLIFLLTIGLFYYAFLSEQRLIVDFSLEQMFPENDPEKEIYDNFRDKFNKDDDVVLLVYVPSDPLNVESMKVSSQVVNKISSIKGLSNCVSIKDFPCRSMQVNTERDNDYLLDSLGTAKFYDYRKTSRTLDSSVKDSLFFRVYNYSQNPLSHSISISGVIDSSPVKLHQSENFTDYVILLDDKKNDNMICLEEVTEYQSEVSQGVSIDVYQTPYFMVEGCMDEPGVDKKQKIYSLSNLKHKDTGELYFPFDGPVQNNEQVYYWDENENSILDCEPFGCGQDDICPPHFYESLDIDVPDSYSYPGMDRNEWSKEDYYSFELTYENFEEDLDLLIDKIGENYNDLWQPYNQFWDCEEFYTAKRTAKAYVGAHPLFNNVILSNSGQVGGILINLDDRIQGQDIRSSFFKNLDQIIEENEESYNWQWHDGGIPVLRTRYIELVHKERNTFIPLAFLVVTMILLFIFRQIKSVVLPIVTMSLALVWVSALMAFLSISINIVSYLTYNLLLIIGCSNAIHIQMKYHEGLFAGKSQISALREVISKIGGALFLTSFTTSIGFLSLCMTNIRLTREFGFILGVGVFVMFFMMITVLPLMLLISKKPKSQMSKRLVKGGSYGVILWINRVVNQYPKRIVVASVLLFIVSFIGLMRIDYNVSVLDDLKPSNQLYKDISAVEGNMGGVFPLETLIEFKEPINKKNGKWDSGEPFTDALNGKWDEGEDFIDLNLNKIWDSGEPFTDALNGRWDSGEKFIDSVDSLNFEKNLAGIAEMKNKILRLVPVSSASTVTDIISMQPNPNPYEAFEDFVSNPDDRLSKIMTGFVYDDMRTIRISGRMINVRADEAKDIKDSISKFSNEIFSDRAQTVSTGSTFLTLKTADHLVKNLTNSFFLAFIIIFVSMIFLFKSFKLSFISILPNIIPLMFAAAVMGFQDIKLRPTTAMTFAIALGIAVDDTIHFLARFRQEYAKTTNIQKSIKNTLETTGKAIISTTIVLSLGFAVLYFSDLMPNHEFGILSTIILSAALVGSVLLLPALLVLFKPKLKVKKNEH